MTTKATHARIVRMFETDIHMSEENTVYVHDEIYETGKMNDEARAAFDALIALAEELE